MRKQYTVNGPVTNLTEKVSIELFKEEREIYSRFSLFSPESITDPEMGRTVELNADNSCHTVLSTLTECVPIAGHL